MTRVVLSSVRCVVGGDGSRKECAIDGSRAVRLGVSLSSDTACGHVRTGRARYAVTRRSSLSGTTAI